MEEQILLRVPPEIAKRLSEMIEEGRAAAASSSSAAAGLSAASPVSLAFTSDRRALLTYDGQAHDATLVDLPCHIETHKTWDSIAFYKTADIAQMLVLHAAAALPNTAAATAATAAQQQQTAGNAAGGAGGAGKEEKKEAAAAAASAAPPIRSSSGLLPPTRDIRPKRYDRETVVPVRDSSNGSAAMLDRRLDADVMLCCGAVVCGPPCCRCSGRS
jgi:TATA-binding protein-associated factor Taf7